MKEIEANERGREKIVCVSGFLTLGNNFARVAKSEFRLLAEKEVSFSILFMT